MSEVNDEEKKKENNVKCSWEEVKKSEDKKVELKTVLREGVDEGKEALRRKVKTFRMRERERESKL